MGRRVARAVGGVFARKRRKRKRRRRRGRRRFGRRETRRRRLFVARSTESQKLWLSTARIGRGSAAPRASEPRRRGGAASEASSGRASVRRGEDHAAAHAGGRVGVDVLGVGQKRRPSGPTEGRRNGVRVPPGRYPGVRVRDVRGGRTRRVRTSVAGRRRRARPRGSRLVRAVRARAGRAGRRFRTRGAPGPPTAQGNDPRV